MFVLVGTPDAPFTEIFITNEQNPKSHLHLFGTMKVVIDLEEVLLLKYIRTTDDLHKSPKQRGLSVSPLLQDQQQVSPMSSVLFAGPRLLSQRTTADSIAKPAVTQVILIFPSISSLDAKSVYFLKILTTSSRVTSTGCSFQKDNGKISTFLDPIIISFISVSDHNALSSGGSEIMASGKPPKVLQ